MTWHLDKEKRKRITKRARVNRHKLVIKVATYKLGEKCNRCGEYDPRCLTFHHPKPKTKEFGISDGVARLFRWEKILKEIKKCELICSNCHFKEHIEYDIPITWP